MIPDNELNTIFNTVAENLKEDFNAMDVHKILSVFVGELMDREFIIIPPLD